MISKEIDSKIREVLDFPKKGISFKDITPLLMDKNLSDKIILEFKSRVMDFDIDAVIGIESRGFLYGFLLANKLGVPFIPIRKSGKLPGKTIKYKYDLEYGSSEVEIHKDDIKKDWNVLIHDDLLATGGTACAAAELVNLSGARVAAFSFIVSLDFLNPNEKLFKYSSNIINLVEYK